MHNTATTARHTAAWRRFAAAWRHSSERPLSCVPWPVWLMLALALGLQLLLHSWQAVPLAKAEDLPPAPDYPAMRLYALGEPVAYAKLSMLSLQAYDYQPGISIPFRNLNYPVVRGWLERILDLDAQGQYPLLAAARLYGEVPDPARQRIMLDFVYQRFKEDPDRRWEAMAHCAILARHRLHDMPLALEYARALREHIRDKRVPSWARQMEVFMLEDMNELQAAKLLLGGILASHEIEDPHEINFLMERMQALEKKMGTP